MKFILQGTSGLTITEEKAEYKSKNGGAKVHCPVELSATFKSLATFPAAGAKDFLTKVGITAQSLSLIHI